MNKKMVLIPYDKYERLMSNKDEALGEESKENDKLDTDVILAMMPPNLHSRARSLLSVINNIVKWNQHGEIYDQDVCIEGSHIADLTRATLYNYKGCQNYVGMDKFCNILAVNNVPLTLCSNVDVRRKVEDMKCYKQMSCNKTKPCITGRKEVDKRTWISL